MTIGPGVQSIGNSAFNNCSDYLESVEIPDSVESIGDQAFEFDHYLAKVTIGTSEQKPCSVKSIGYAAFREIGSGNSAKTITINTYESHVTEKGDYWCDGPGINVVWLWALVTAAADSSAGGTVTVGGGVPTDDGTAFRKADSATLKAVPNSGYAFAYWTDEDGKVITDGDGKPVGATYAFAVTADSALTANFKPALTVTAKDQTYAYNGETQGEGDYAGSASTSHNSSFNYQGPQAPLPVENPPGKALRHYGCPEPRKSHPDSGVFENPGRNAAARSKGRAAGASRRPPLMKRWDRTGATA